jgi:hypothetical protein
MIKYTPISEISIYFILKNITPYQKEVIQRNWYIYNRFIELRKKPLMDIYQIISEEVNIEMPTVRKIYTKIKNNKYYI